MEPLVVSHRVSSGLVTIARQMSTRPAFVLAKGGITSSDIGTQALAARRVTVLGQVLPGVPVWQLGSEARYPGLLYIIFPGNVGDDDALVRVIAMLRGEASILP